MSGYKRYPAYRESGVEWIGEIPEGWSCRPLKFSLRLHTEKAGDSCTGEFRLGLENVESWTGSYIKTDSEFEGDGISFETGDLLFGKLRPYLAKVLEAPRSGTAVGEFFVLKPANGVSSRFMFYRLLSKPVIDVLDGSTYGAKMPRTSWDDMGGLKLPIPSTSEQDQIAAFLDRKTAQIDRLIEIKGRQIELLKEERTAVINHAVTKGLNPEAKMKESGIEWIGEIPEGWQVKRVKFLAKDGSGIQMGPFGSMLSKLPNGPTGYKLYGQENTISGNFSSGNRWLEPSRFSELEKYIMEEGDIVLTRKGSIGNCRLVPEGIMPGVIDSDTIRVRVNDNLISSHFFVLLLHDAWYLQSQILCNCRGAILSGLNTSTISELFIMCPPRAEQTEIEAFLRNELLKIANLENTAKKTIQFLQEYRATLISDAVTGKIDVREEAA